MKKKSIIIPIALTLTLLSGCTPKTKSMEVNVSIPQSIEQGEQQSLTWNPLAQLTTTPSLRKAWDDTLKITPNDTGKNGIIFVDADGNNEPNNTLRVAMHNREFTKQLKDEATRLELANASASEYADIEVTDTDKAVYMGINGYFNLLPDNTPNYSNPDSTITRGEFMAMVYRAETPVQDIESDDTFTTAVGESEYNVYAQSIAEDSYLDLATKSLNNLTYNGTITRAEAVYLLMQHYFADELATVETKGIKFEDAKDSGSATGATGDYSKSDALNSALQNPDKGMPTELYKALALAKEIGLVGTETRWDEGLTKSEAIELTLIALENEKGIASFNASQGKVEGETEEPAPAIEDVTVTEEDEVAAANKFDESVFTPDVTEDQKKRMRAFAEEVDMSYTEMADDNGDGKVDSAEVKSLLDFCDWLAEDDNNGTTPSGGATGGGSGTGESSTNYIGPTIGTPSSGELPPSTGWDDVDLSGASPTAQMY